MVCRLLASPAPQTSGPKAPLYDNLGNSHYAITTSSPDAQKYFDQGLTLSYAFNHAEAIRAFRQAAALDPNCAMCYWGVAFALGPNINAPITEEAAKEAWQAIGQARARRCRRAREGARVHRGAREALHGRSEGRARAARSRVRRRDARGDDALSGRPRRRDALRPVADGHLAVELLGEGRQPAAVHQRRARGARVGAGAEAGPHRRDPPLHPRGRSVARIPAARRRTPTSSPRSCPAPAISCTCRRTSTCGPAATTTRRSRTRTPSRPTRPISRATPSPAT